MLFFQTHPGNILVFVAVAVIVGYSSVVAAPSAFSGGSSVAATDDTPYDSDPDNYTSSFEDSDHHTPEVPDLRIPSVKIRDKDVHDVQSVLIGGVTTVQNSLINFLSGIFDSVKKVIETSSGKVVNILNDSVNRTNAVNADYLATGKEIVDTFSQSFKNSTKLTKNLVGAFSSRGGGGKALDDVDFD
ncbi:uncharacterized protein LOC129581328 [Paramacrobiotus metropolitanus]|uniref:uncharacterized protein LOC129581328 n=1 Tax=Paramacrobiotus metropolitanus TaxID=2943436 RepID=UPI002446066F|nr:uncharacterized protein LOC129581328 [Paramacrobiotus metropolitanus]